MISKKFFGKKYNIIVITLLLVFIPTSAGVVGNSTIIEMDGYAQLSEGKTIAETRQEAFANAKRQALESAKVYIESYTKVRNYTFEEDVIESIAKGTVELLDQEDYGIEGNSRYHIWIKARINVYKIEKALRKNRDSKEIYSDSIESSTIQFFPEHEGLIRNKLVGAKMEFSLKGLSGVASVFTSYKVRISCSHDYHLLTQDEKKEGKFYFENPVMIPPNRLVKVELYANQWVIDNINSMYRTLSTDEISLQIILEGVDLDWQPLKVKMAGAVY